MKPIPIPVVGIGAGSQPGADQDLDYAPLPKMETFAMPELPAGDDPRHVAAAARVVEQLVATLQRPQAAAQSVPPLALADYAPEVVSLLNQALGQGEVSIIVRALDGESEGGGADSERVRIQESAFAGLWRVQQFDAAGRLVADTIEVGDIPPVVRAMLPREHMADASARSFPKGLMNAPAVLNELAHRAARYQPGSQAHVINLTLLPMTPEDLSAIDAALGQGPVTILSRGFGNCRISSTRVANVWRVQYFNTMETLILNIIEVSDVPAVALAAPEDIADTRERLVELLEWMREQ